MNDVCDMCEGCPFAYTEESEKIQNYGCLPTHNDIVNDYKEGNGHWKCHSRNKRCSGLSKSIEKYGLKNENNKLLVTEDNPLISK